MVRKPVECWVGSVSPAELIRWERKGDLVDSARRELQEAIIRRIRPKADLMWPRLTGVRLMGRWTEHVSKPERKALDAVIGKYMRPLEELTLLEVKQCMHMPLQQLLDLLARLEALYWVPSEIDDAAQVRAGEPLSAVQDETVELTDDLADKLKKVLQLSWISGVDREDVRFSFSGQAALAELIGAALQSGKVRSYTVDLVTRMLAAEQMTAAEEVLDIARAAVKKCGPRGADGGQASRWVAMFMRRHISPEGDGRILADVGEEFGVTRERIRQVCATVEDYLREVPTATPAIDRLMRACARAAPSSAKDLDGQLQRFIGEGAGLQSLFSWLEAIGRTGLPVKCDRVRTSVRGEWLEVAMIVLPDQPAWVEPMVRHVTRDSYMYGCTSVLRVAGRLALKEGLAPAQESMEAALEAMRGFRWLDKETGWFALGESDECSAAARIRKVMAVAKDHVGADEIAAALASDDMLVYRDNRTLGLATPPVHVLRELMTGWQWLKPVQRGRFVAAPNFSKEGVLSEAEQVLVDVIEAHDGVACRFEMRDLIKSKLGYTNELLAAVLGSSPIILRFEHGLYGLRGQRIGDEALRKARQRQRVRAAAQAGGGRKGEEGLVLSQSQFVARVSEASLRNEQYTVPKTLRDRLWGTRCSLLDEQGKLIGEVRVTQFGQLKGINKAITGLVPGDTVVLEATSTEVRVVETRHVAG